MYEGSVVPQMIKCKCALLFSMFNILLFWMAVNCYLCIKILCSSTLFRKKQKKQSLNI